jgi:hypothetical protein
MLWCKIWLQTGLFFAWEMIKKAHHQHKSIKFNFDFTKSFKYSDEWPTNPGISDSPEMHRAKGFLYATPALSIPGSYRAAQRRIAGLYNCRGPGLSHN